MKYEIQLWLVFILKNIPGSIGCFLRKLILPIKIGKGSSIWEGCHIDSPSKLNIGDNVSINRGVLIHAGGGVEIQNDVLIGPNVVIYSQNHNYKIHDVLIREQGYTRSKVVIESDVWIGCNVVILPGVRIGRGCVIAAGAVITKSVESFSIVAGVPGKVIAKRVDYVIE